MKTIIFSDTHLTRRFNLRKFMFLANLIKDADRVVINGDFWDNTYTDFDGFINSKWKLLFPILKSKETIYLYGNHDRDWQVDDRARLFSDYQGYEYQINNGYYELLITHGHTIREGLERLNRLYGIRRFKKLGQFIFEIIEWLGVKLVRRFGKNIFPHRFLDNRAIKAHAITLPPGQYLVCGHTHLAFFKPGNQYINTGSIRFGHAHYLELTGKTLKLHRWRY